MNITMYGPWTPSNPSIVRGWPHGAPESVNGTIRGLHHLTGATFHRVTVGPFFHGVKKMFVSNHLYIYMIRCSTYFMLGTTYKYIYIYIVYSVLMKILHKDYTIDYSSV